MDEALGCLAEAVEEEPSCIPAPSRLRCCCLLAALVSVPGQGDGQRAGGLVPRAHQDRGTREDGGLPTLGLLNTAPRPYTGRKESARAASP